MLGDTLPTVTVHQTPALVSTSIKALLHCASSLCVPPSIAVVGLFVIMSSNIASIK